MGFGSPSPYAGGRGGGRGGFRDNRDIDFRHRDRDAPGSYRGGSGGSYRNNAARYGSATAAANVERDRGWNRAQDKYAQREAEWKAREGGNRDRSRSKSRERGRDRYDSRDRDRARSRSGLLEATLAEDKRGRTLSSHDKQSLRSRPAAGPRPDRTFVRMGGWLQPRFTCNYEGGLNGNLWGAATRR